MSPSTSPSPNAISSPRPFTYANGRLTCSGADLTELAERFGTPLYVYSADAIRERVAMLQTEFSTVPHTICYAVKANSSLAILKLLGELGCGFDIVSGGELERVRRADPAALSRVVFSGVGKQIWEIDAALNADILLFNVESEAELELLATRAQALSKTARIALRVNPDVFAETHPYISTGLRDEEASGLKEQVCVETVEDHADGSGILGDAGCGVEGGGSVLDAKSASAVDEADLEPVGPQFLDE